ncbi:MAG TPA: ATP-binding cassette domain-containing protein [bacterium]|nr:ATP-binding cassette domain-containing protein [bacterium]
MLEVKNIKKTFGGLVALKDLSLNVESQKITSLIGPNGAGKTTLFNIIAGSLKTDSGEVSFLGRNVTKIPPYRICQLGIARTYQLRNIFPNLTVFENICAGLWKDNSLNFQDREQRVYEILSYFDLAKKAKYIVSNLPPLEIKLVELGRALATNPKLLLLDELLGGLIGPETLKICEIVEDLRSKGYTILQIGHEIKPIMRTSDWIYVLNEGEKVAEGIPDVIKENAEVLRIYLGLEV